MKKSSLSYLTIATVVALLAAGSTGCENDGDASTLIRSALTTVSMSVSVVLKT